MGMDEMDEMEIVEISSTQCMRMLRWGWGLLFQDDFDCYWQLPTEMAMVGAHDGADAGN